MVRATARPHRVLLVDDDPRSLFSLAALFAPLGCIVEEATSGAEALVRVLTSPPDLVLLDFAMPGFAGVDFLLALRDEPSRKAIPIVVVTAQSDRTSRLRCLEAGADEFLEKPPDAGILVARVRNLLALKHSRDDLAARNAELRTAQREQRELTDFVVHDLKNQTMLVGLSLEAVQRCVGLASKEDLDAILDEGRLANGRVSAMLKDLLAVSRLEQGDFPICEESTNVRDLLSRVLTSYQRRASEKNVACELAADPLLHARTDPWLLQRVVENIVDNAVRFTPKDGRIHVNARSGESLTIAISNNGPPIPPTERDRVFDKFTRLGAVRDGASHAGLGLYFCRRAIEAVRGRIGVAESGEWPTTFVIELPLGVS